MPGIEENFERLRRSAAMAPLSPQSMDEVLQICSTLIEERRRIRVVLEQLPPNFTAVRDALNELAKAVR